MVSIPLYTSNYLQPLDVSYFGPLKAEFHTQYENHKIIAECDLASIFNKTYSIVAKISIFLSGFAKIGIFPLNPKRYKEERFQTQTFTEDSIDIKIKPIEDESIIFKTEISNFCCRVQQQRTGKNLGVLRATENISFE
ncbi:hypothetical protein ILUMI_26141 [Ignelater luminosus]|uniref:Uncharacterized protein n=1 Tax=Ignelater luminosus TaxID=2038154 RepID=A0A8K0FW06_IGNLU|nr:hypothetical protein ILUMI_26141 [Ignelater luminosus]